MPKTASTVLCLAAFCALSGCADASGLTAPQSAQAPVPWLLLVTAHATLLTLGFLCIAAGIASAKFFRSRRWWLTYHKPIGVAGSAFSVLGFAVAFIMVDVTSTIHFRVLHSILGAITLPIAVGTPILGAIIFSNNPNKRAFRLYHRIAGRTTLALMALTLLFGLHQAGLLF